MLRRLAGVGDVDRTALAALVLLDFVADLLVLVERGQAAALDVGNVDEAVLAAVIRLDEAIALVGVEKFYSACRHGNVFLSQRWPPIGHRALGEATRRNEEPQSAWRPSVATSSKATLGDLGAKVQS